jgi:hypothetical protein
LIRGDQAVRDCVAMGGDNHKSASGDGSNISQSHKM